MRSARALLVIIVAVAVALAALDRLARAAPPGSDRSPLPGETAPPGGIERFTVFSGGRAEDEDPEAAPGAAGGAQREDAASDSSLALIVAASLTAMLAATHRGRATALVS